MTKIEWSTLPYMMLVPGDDFIEVLYRLQVEEGARVLHPAVLALPAPGYRLPRVAPAIYRDSRLSTTQDASCDTQLTVSPRPLPARQATRTAMCMQW